MYCLGFEVKDCSIVGDGFFCLVVILWASVLAAQPWRKVLRSRVGPPTVVVRCVVG